jgi:tetrapyrrole methylase family protein/MazG family protein
LLQIVFQSVVAEEKGYFRLHDVLSRINQKMIERHPHVFGQTKADTAEEVADNWESIKLHKEKRNSVLSGIPENSPALLRAQRIQEKASRLGFDWKKTEDVIDKIYEEVSELRTALQDNRTRDIQEEFGDLLFSLVNLSRFLGIVSEDALRLSTKKFIGRFEEIEKYYGNDHQKIKSATLEELDRIWEEIKDRSRE